MARKDPRIDAYITNAAAFAQPILRHLRNLIHAGCPEVEETVKWSMPAFTYQGPLCNMGAFKAHCIFGFWKHALILEPPANGETKRAMGAFGRITSLDEIPADHIMLRYIRKAAELNAAGVKLPGRPKTATKELKLPDYFLAALKKNARARTTFEQFSYSHKKEYLEWLTEAKREETRQRRLETTVAWLTEGKPRNWKYQNC
jgi:uncharacterized protein YdeI (YjbR/CyaY-like superfamily)